MDRPITPKPDLPLRVLKEVGEIERNTREILDPIGKSIIHWGPIPGAYFLDVPHITRVLRTSANDSFAARAKFYESQKGFRFEWLNEVVNETVSATMNLATPLRIYHTFRDASIPAQLRAFLQMALEQRAPEPKESRGNIESVRAGRRKLCNDYKAECRLAGVRVTDEMIAKAANPRWHSRANIQKWLACDPNYDGWPDRQIRTVFLNKHHLP